MAIQCSEYQDGRYQSIRDLVAQGVRFILNGNRVGFAQEEPDEPVCRNCDGAGCRHCDRDASY
jgi:hypothetical protein